MTNKEIYQNSCKIDLSSEKEKPEIRLIDANALKYKNLAEVNGRLTYVLTAEDIDNAPTVAVSCKDCDGYEAGYSAGLKDTEIPQGDIFPMEIVAGKCPIEVGGNCPLKPQGKWVDEGQYAEGHSEHAYTCKKCGYHIIEKPNMISENRFCKNCGAEMKGGAE